MPTRREELEGQRLASPTQALSEELTSYDDPRADAIAYVFERVGWLMRLMYMTLAALTALIYYFKGHDWAERQRQAPEAGPPQRKPGLMSVTSSFLSAIILAGGRSRRMGQDKALLTTSQRSAAAGPYRPDCPTANYRGCRGDALARALPQVVPPTVQLLLEDQLTGRTPSGTIERICPGMARRFARTGVCC